MIPASAQEPLVHEQAVGAEVAHHSVGLAAHRGHRLRVHQVGTVTFEHRRQDGEAREGREVPALQEGEEHRVGGHHHVGRRPSGQAEEHLLNVARERDTDLLDGRPRVLLHELLDHRAEHGPARRLGPVPGRDLQLGGRRRPGADRPEQGRGRQADNPSETHHSRPHPSRHPVASFQPVDPRGRSRRRQLGDRSDPRGLRHPRCQQGRPDPPWCDGPPEATEPHTDERTVQSVGWI